MSGRGRSTPDEASAGRPPSGAAERGAQQPLFDDIPVGESVDAAAEGAGEAEERGTADTKRVAQKLATLVSEENARLYEKLVEPLRETEERLAEAVRERAVEDGDIGLARRVAAAGVRPGGFGWRRRGALGLCCSSSWSWRAAPR